MSKEKIEAKIRQSEAMLGTMNNAGGRNELMRTISKDKIDLDKIKTALGKVEKEVKIVERGGRKLYETLGCKVPWEGERCRR